MVLIVLDIWENYMILMKQWSILIAVLWVNCSQLDISFTQDI